MSVENMTNTVHSVYGTFIEIWNPLRVKMLHVRTIFNARDLMLT